MKVKVERLRDFVGLDNANLMRVVAKAVDIVKSKTTQKKKPTVEAVHAWLIHNVKWGTRRTPSVRTVGELISNWEAIKSDAAAFSYVEHAMTRWGRENLFDWPTKLSIIIARTDKKSLSYAVESLYTFMCRKDEKDPYTLDELKKVLNDIMWMRVYTRAFLKDHPALLEPRTGLPETTRTLANKLLIQPHAFFEKVEGPNRDATWITALPSEALRQFFGHLKDLRAEYYKPEIRGALSQVGQEKYNFNKFHEAERVNRRFWAPFQIAYDSLTSSGNAGQRKDEEEKKEKEEKDEEKKEEEKKESEKKKDPVPSASVSAFRQQCEEFCRNEIEARVVILLNQGAHSELRNHLTGTRLYQNLTAGVRSMGFYDVKNARVIEVSCSEGRGGTFRCGFCWETGLELCDI